VSTTTIGSPGSMCRPQAMHSHIDIRSLVRQHARQTGAPALRWYARAAVAPHRVGGSEVERSLTSTRSPSSWTNRVSGRSSRRTGIVVESWYVMMGLGHVATLRVPPPARLREFNRSIEATAWKAFRSEIYATYDFKEVAKTARERVLKK
jgi:hypothetical protein